MLVIFFHFHINLSFINSDDSDIYYSSLYLYVSLIPIYAIMFDAPVFVTSIIVVFLVILFGLFFFDE
jgi:hypothetical protein